MLARLRGISKTENEILIRLKSAIRLNDDTAAVFAKLNQTQEKRNVQHISLRPREGIALSTRVLTPLQVFKMIEDICEALAAVRGARFLGDG